MSRLPGRPAAGGHPQRRGVDRLEGRGRDGLELVEQPAGPPGVGGALEEPRRPVVGEHQAVASSSPAAPRVVVGPKPVGRVRRLEPEARTHRRVRTARSPSRRRAGPARGGAGQVTSVVNRMAWSTSPVLAPRSSAAARAGSAGPRRRRTSSRAGAGRCWSATRPRRSRRVQRPLALAGRAGLVEPAGALVDDDRVPVAARRSRRPRSGCRRRAGSAPGRSRRRSRRCTATLRVGSADHGDRDAVVRAVAVGRAEVRVQVDRPVDMCDSHAALRASTGRPRTSACQKLFAGNTGQEVPGRLRVPPAAVPPAAASRPRTRAAVAAERVLTCRSSAPRGLRRTPVRVTRPGM